MHALVRFAHVAAGNTFTTAEIGSHWQCKQGSQKHKPCPRRVVVSRNQGANSFGSRTASKIEISLVAARLTAKLPPSLGGRSVAVAEFLQRFLHLIARHGQPNSRPERVHIVGQIDSEKRGI